MIEQRENYPSASALERYHWCKASYRMGIMAAEYGQLPPPSKEAQAGTRLHEALLYNNPNRLHTDEERNLYSQIVHNLNKVLDWWGAQDTDQVYKEERLWLHDGVVPIFSGQADYVRVRGDEGIVIDLKTGWERVNDPISNHQLCALAILAANHYNLRRVTTQIVSPHYEFRPMALDRFYLRRYEEELRALLAELAEAQKPVPGGYCKYCRGFLICPEVRKNASLIKLNQNVDFPSSLPEGEAGAKILNELKMLEKFIEACWEHYKLIIAKDPSAIPGWHLVPGRKVREMKPAIEIWQEVRDLLGEEKDIWKTVSFTIGAIEKQLPKGAKIPDNLVSWKQNPPLLEKEKKAKLAL